MIILLVISMNSSFKINRSQNKVDIFNDVIFKVMEGDKSYQSELMSN
jgi:hypothetical protein